MRVPNSSFRVRFPTAMVLLTLSLAMVGVVNIASAARLTKPNLFWMQLLWLLLGAIGVAIVASVRTSWFRHMAYPFYGFVVLLLMAVLVIGTSAKGSQRWLDFGVFRMQPSELAKLSVVFATARFCTDYQIIGGYRLRDLIRPFNLSRPFLLLIVAVSAFTVPKFSQALPFIANPTAPKTILFVVGIFTVIVLWFYLAFLQLRKEGWHFYQVVSLGDLVLLPFALILVEPDLGTASIVLAISGSMILFCGMRASSLVIAAGFGVAVAIVGWNFVLKDYQKQRVESFLNPEADIRGQGYHAAQSIIAVGSGQILGKGFAEGTQTQLSFLPENHTDFVFSVLAEEWGFLATSLVMILFMCLIISMLRVGMRAQDRFEALLAVGAAAVIFWHVTVNVGMVTGILPVVGVTLPFVSYGGASLMTKMVAIGICMNVAVWRRVK